MIIKKQIFNEKEVNIIKKFILDNQNYIKSLGPSRYPQAGENALTGRFDIYNFFNSDIGPLLRKKIEPFLEELNFFKPLSIQCWANTLSKNESIKLHKHTDGLQSFYCANIFISGKQEIGTYYVKEADPEYSRNLSKGKVIKKFDSIPGEISLFDCNLPHYVKSNSSKDVRISMAMDIYQNTIFNNNDRYFVIK